MSEMKKLHVVSMSGGKDSTATALMAIELHGREACRFVFAAHRAAGIEPNPLYRQGMNRVGCMPCINCGKAELAQIARRFPEHIERIAAWERLVSQVCRPLSPVSFFHHGTKGHSGQPSTIAQVVEWSKTSRGGRQFSLLTDLDEPTACSSAYGLCE